MSQQPQKPAAAGVTFARAIPWAGDVVESVAVERNVDKIVELERGVLLVRKVKNRKTSKDETHNCFVPWANVAALSYEVVGVAQ